MLGQMVQPRADRADFLQPCLPFGRLHGQSGQALVSHGQSDALHGRAGHAVVHAAPSHSFQGVLQAAQTASHGIKGFVGESELSQHVAMIFDIKICV